MHMSKILTENIIPVPVDTLHLAKRMSAIRNTCKDTMTQHTQIITDDQQTSWWLSLDHSTCRCWLFAIDDGGVEPIFVAYGMLRLLDGKWWESRGILPEFRGKGLGTIIVEFLVKQCDDDVWSDILSMNTAAIRSAEIAGLRVEQSMVRMRTHKGNT